MYIAILGFGFKPPVQNLELAEQATAMLVEQNFGITVGNVCGTFLTALETADRLDANGVAVVDDSMSTEMLPVSTKVNIVAAAAKHDRIATLASGGLILGGAGGTRKLSGKLIDAGHPVAAVRGTGGAVDDGSLSKSIALHDTVEEAVEYLASQLASN